MRTTPVLLFAACVWLAQAAAGEQRPVLDMAPSIAELGADWTTNTVISVLDPPRPSSGTNSKADLTQKKATSASRKAKQATGQTAWVRIEYSRRDTILNPETYYVSIQRWSNTNALDKVWTGWKTRPEYTFWHSPPFGEDAFWTEDNKFHGLTFRRGIFHVVITCGSQSAHAGLFRLAEVIDAKIQGKSIPKAEAEPIGEPQRKFPAANE